MAERTDPEEGPGGERLRRATEGAERVASARIEEAREAAWQSAERARRRAEAEAERGKNRSAEELHAWAGALERAARELGEDTAQARVVRAAAQRLDDVARTIETRSVGHMVADLARFGRRNPALFAGGAMLAGFALSRFATASPDHHSETEEETR